MQTIGATGCWCGNCRRFGTLITDPRSNGVRLESVRKQSVPFSLAERRCRASCSAGGAPVLWAWNLSGDEKLPAREHGALSKDGALGCPRRVCRILVARVSGRRDSTAPPASGAPAGPGAGYRHWSRRDPLGRARVRRARRRPDSGSDSAGSAGGGGAWLRRALRGDGHYPDSPPRAAVRSDRGQGSPRSAATALDLGCARNWKPTASRCSARPASWASTSLPRTGERCVSCSTASPELHRTNSLYLLI